jgi:hypothetical protein
MRRAPIECGDRRERRETCERRKADHLCVSHRSMMQPLSALHQKIQFVGEHIGASQRHYSLLSLWYKLSVRPARVCASVPTLPRIRRSMTPERSRRLPCAMLR